VSEDLGQLEEAAAVMETVLESRTRTLGPVAEDTLSTMNRLGTILTRMGAFDRASA
jgi:hypothetical protein